LSTANKQKQNFGKLSTTSIEKAKVLPNMQLEIKPSLATFTVAKNI
jgi:hypothetical protein